MAGKGTLGQVQRKYRVKMAMLKMSSEWARQASLRKRIWGEALRELKVAAG